MKPHSRAPEQDDLLRPQLVDMIDARHELVKLAALIDWEFFEREWAQFFPSHWGRPATSPRLIAGLMYLQHAFNLSDEAVVARWVENPYYQHFTGETFFQHGPPIDPSSMSRWRKRIGEEGVEWLLTKTIEAARSSGAVTDKSLKRVSVDTTVMEKNIAHPTDARLYERARRQLVALAAEAGLTLRQNYNRLAPRLARQVGRYAHARQFKRMRKALKKLKGYTGRVLRDIRRQLDDIPAGALRERVLDMLVVGAAVDVFPEEPKNAGDAFDSELRHLPNVILTPHIGGSTEEAQQDIGLFVSAKLRDYVDYGTTSLSVNVPSLILDRPREGGHRIAHLHRNVPGVLAGVNQALSKVGVNVESQVLGTWGDIGYVATDVDAPVPAEAVAELEAMDPTIRVRVLEATASR